MKIGVLGAGTWGTALARMLSNTGHCVTVWSAIEREVEELSQNRRHPNLKDMIVPENIVFTSDICEACSEKEMVLVVVPSIYVRSTMQKASKFVEKNAIVVNLAKGIEKNSLKTMSEVIADELGSDENLVVLSGPTHAEEVAKDLPTTIVSASTNEKSAEIVQNVFSNSFMRVYTNSDVVGVELCGAIKNIIALASGISSGLGFGDNAKAALITRGAAEIARLGKAAGCDERTFYGLAGVGDLIVTATSSHSRNNHAGFLIGQGKTADEAIDEVGMVVEGINALEAAVEYAKKYDVEMPIVFAVNEIVNHGANPKDMVERLMMREYKSETV